MAVATALLHALLVSAARAAPLHVLMADTDLLNIAAYWCSCTRPQGCVISVECRKGVKCHSVVR
jgi:hypothetical protein